MNRREFTIEAALMLLGGATISIGGCGGGGGGGGGTSPTASDLPLRDAMGTVLSNHGHAAVITAAQLGGGDALQLDIRGTSGHTHTVALSATDLLSIRRGARVQVESSGSSHTHGVVFN